jgi:hypothetical protein
MEGGGAARKRGDGGGQHPRAWAPSVSAREMRALPPPAAPLRYAGEENMPSRLPGKVELSGAIA